MKPNDRQFLEWLKLQPLQRAVYIDAVEQFGVMPVARCIGSGYVRHDLAIGLPDLWLTTAGLAVLNGPAPGLFAGR